MRVGILLEGSCSCAPQGCAGTDSHKSKEHPLRTAGFPWNGLRHLGDSGNGGTTLEFLSPFLRRAPLLGMRREYREFFPYHAGTGSLLSSYEAETGHLWIWRNYGASSRVESGMSVNFLSCSKGVKDPLEVPEVRCD